MSTPFDGVDLRLHYLSARWPQIAHDTLDIRMTRQYHDGPDVETAPKQRSDVIRSKLVQEPHRTILTGDAGVTVAAVQASILCQDFQATQ